MKRRKSIKTRVLAVLFMTQIPLITIIIVYSVYFVNYFNQSLSRSNSTALGSYCATLEDDLERLEDSLLNFIASDISYKMLYTDDDYLDAHINSLEIMEFYENIIKENPFLYGCYIINAKHQIFRGSYSHENTDYYVKQELVKHFSDYLNQTEAVFLDQWEPLKLKDKSFLYMVKGVQGTYCILLLDVSMIHVPQNSVEDAGGRILFFSEDNILNDQAWAQNHEIQLNSSDKYYFSGSPQRYLVIERPVENAQIRAAYLSQYNGLLGNMSLLQKSVILVSVGIIIILLPVGYYRLKRVFFNPIDRLVGTMEAIRNGQMETRADEDYSESEFLTVNQTFNSMISEINELKIEAYEKELDLQQKELDLQKTQLDYYQTQIRPHFYVNCLKSIHGLLEEEHLEDCKKAVVLLSRHLRYMLKGPSVAVTLEEELTYVENYIDLQKISMAYPPKLTIEIGEDEKFFSIPAISVLSFVENSIKYGSKAGCSLVIAIVVSQMESEEGRYINISISDNGPGFDEKMMDLLNRGEDPSSNGRHMGIYNVMQRLELYYGKEYVLCAFSNMDGAHVDIFIKEEDKQ